MKAYTNLMQKKFMAAIDDKTKADPEFAEWLLKHPQMTKAGRERVTKVLKEA